MIKKILLICSLFVFGLTLHADEQTELKQLFLSKLDKVISLVGDKSISKEKRNSDIVSVMTPTFDFELMAKLSLGNAWKSLNAQEREKFVKLYVKRMEQSFSPKLDAYSNEKVEIKKIDQPKDDRISFVTDLVKKDENLEIVYKFYKPRKQEENKDTWLIYDVEILGVSMLKTDKAQFKDFLQTKSIAELMEALSK